jgi:uncharacterized repeat protein (TIGR03803 family)
VLKVNTDGTGSAILRTFTNSPDGATPEASLVCAGNTLYGTTSAGGKSGNGTVFKLNTDGTGYAILCNFSNTPDGASPQASLCLNGSLLYGTTANGGSAGDGTIFVINTNGTGYAVLKNFTNSPDGANPQAGLLWAGNTLYGTTSSGGNAGDGTLFQINPDGTGYAVLHNFLGHAQGDGSGPSGKLAMGNGTLYGTTFSGGTNQNSGGTIFSCTPAPPPLRAGASGNLPVLFWPNDGFNHTLQTTTNLNSGNWTTVTNGAPVIGVLVTNAPGQASGFFRLQ